MKIQNGYYWIKINGFIVPARWDGNQWYHEKGVSSAVTNHSNVLMDGWVNKLNKLLGLTITPLTGGGCPLGCVCTPNSDGSIHVNCNP